VVLKIGSITVFLAPLANAVFVEEFLLFKLIISIFLSTKHPKYLNKPADKVHAYVQYDFDTSLA
jgi:hypothetical protein